MLGNMVLFEYVETKHSCHKTIENGETASINCLNPIALVCFWSALNYANKTKQKCPSSKMWMEIVSSYARRLLNDNIILP